MRKKILRVLLLFLLFFSTTSTVLAEDYEYRYAEINDELFTCKYYNSKNNNELIIEVGVRGNNYIDGVSISTYVNGATKYNKLLHTEELPANTLGENEMVNYVTFHSTCPKYAGSYPEKKGYALSDNKESLSGSDYIMELDRLEYNDDDYCFYTFTDEFEWGFFAKKNLFVLEQNNTGKECPAKVVAELNASVKDEITDVRKYYGTEEDGAALEVTKQKCVSDAVNYLKEKHNEKNPLEEDSGVKCYVGKLQDVKSFEKGINKPNETDNTQIDCSSLFDAETGKFINGAYFVLEVLAILLVVILTIKDYAAAILNSNQDEMKKANKRLITRLIIVVVILLLPALIKLLLKLFKIELFSSDPFCGTIKK